MPTDCMYPPVTNAHKELNNSLRVFSDADMSLGPRPRTAHTPKHGPAPVVEPGPARTDRPKVTVTQHTSGSGRGIQSKAKMTLVSGKSRPSKSSAAPAKATGPTLVQIAELISANSAAMREEHNQSMSQLRDELISMNKDKPRRKSRKRSPSSSSSSSSSSDGGRKHRRRSRSPRKRRGHKKRRRRSSGTSGRSKSHRRSSSRDSTRGRSPRRATRTPPDSPPSPGPRSGKCIPGTAGTPHVPETHQAAATAPIPEHIPLPPEAPPVLVREDPSATPAATHSSSPEQSAASPPPARSPSPVTHPATAFTKAQIDARRLKLVFEYIRSDNTGGWNLKDPTHREFVGELFDDKVVTTDLEINPPKPPASATTAELAASPTKAPGTSDTPEPAATDAKHAKERGLIRRILKEGLPLTGVQAVRIQPDSKRAVLKNTWHKSLDGTSSEPEAKLGWPLHRMVADTREAIYEKLTDHAVTKKEQEAKLTKFDRVPETILPTSGHDFYWTTAPDPGWDKDRPKDPYPLILKNSPNPVVMIDRADLTNRNTRDKESVKVANVVAHGIDIMHELAERHLPPGADRDLFSDTLEIVRDAAAKLLINTQASVISSAVFERHQTMARDDKVQLNSLHEAKKAKARLGPVDSDDYVFGSARLTLEADLKAAREAKGYYLVQQPSTSGRPQNSGQKQNHPNKKNAGKGQANKPGTKLGKVAQMAADAQAARKANQNKKGGKPKGKDGPKQP